MRGNTSCHRSARADGAIAAKDGLKCRRAVATFCVVEAKEAQPSFEAALEKLETIVETMESGEVPLAELLAKFEEGTKLLKVCEARLKDAELKIEQLKKQKDGTVTFEKFATERE
jgi:exodeoxyribonuclease VII small subunit